VDYVGKKCVLKVKLLSVPKEDPCKILAMSAKFSPHEYIILECFRIVKNEGYRAQMDEAPSGMPKYPLMVQWLLESYAFNDDLAKA
jgi:hypothetical protein